MLGAAQRSDRVIVHTWCDALAEAKPSEGPTAFDALDQLEVWDEVLLGKC
jgi:hypothetical protein